MSMNPNCSLQSSSSPCMDTIYEDNEMPELREEELEDEAKDDDEIIGLDVNKRSKRKASDPSEDDAQAFKKKDKEKTSGAWKYMQEHEDDPETGNKRAKCKLCQSVLSRGKTSSTSTLNRHLTSCLKKNGKQMQRQLAFMSTHGKEGEEVNEQLSTFKYDHSKMREKIVHYIMINELPFTHVESFMFNEVMRTATPFWKKVSRASAKVDCHRCYELEKIKLKEVLKGVSKVNVTTDMWTSSNQKLGYMVVTGHWIDINWKLNMRVLNFCNVPPPHSGLVIAETLSSSFIEWGIEKKIGTITVDNARANDVAIRNLKQNYITIREHLPLNGRLFHVRCCAHILNHLVQDGLEPIESIIDKIRDGVKYVAGSEGRRNQFGLFATQFSIPARKLVLDVPTRWNSTYNMLKIACIFKQVFRRLGNWDVGFTYVPNDEDWEKVSNVCEFLEIFNDVTHVVSGSQYPTANLFLSEVYRVKELLDLKYMDIKSYIRDMATPMKEKFDKYWSECNLVMSIGSVLDPRFKLQLLRFCFPIIYGTGGEIFLNTVKDALSDLFNEYVDEKAGERGNNGKGSSIMASSSSNSSSYRHVSVLGKHVLGGISKYGQFLSQSDTSFQPIRTELELYLEESTYPVVGEHFDALDWWKANQGKYPVLSKMAADVLAIPITTVASESTFSAGGRVIEPHRACLKPQTVEMLLCGADWTRELYGLKKISQKEKHKLKEVEIDLNIPDNEASGSINN